MLDTARNRRKLLYRACHRGTAEMDFLLGRFAQQELDGLSGGLLRDFGVLLDLPDPELEALVMGKVVVTPGDWMEDILRLVQAFHGIEG